MKLEKIGSDSSPTKAKEATTKHDRSRNALVHGLYAKDVLLPWDCKEDFEKLHQDLKAEFSPHGRAEEEAVLDLAMLHWQKHTLWRVRQVAVLKDPFTKDILETDRKSWSGIRKSLRSAAKAERTLVGALEAGTAQQLLAQVRKLGSQMAATSDTEEIKRVEENLIAVLRALNDHALPMLERLRQAPNAEQAFDKAYAVDSLERVIRLEAAVDARIAKVLTRLVGLKEFKRTPVGNTSSLGLSDLSKASN
jgi:hypothetical protein